MRPRHIAMITLLLGALVGSAAAVTSAPRPEVLVLHKGDFPGTAKYNWGQMPASFVQGLAALGVDASGAYFAVAVPAGGSTKYKSVQGFVPTAANSTQARTVFEAARDSLRSGSKRALRLPVYGDEQLALYQSPKVGSKVEPLVRRNRVVWQLEIGAAGRW